MTSQSGNATHIALAITANAANLNLSLLIPVDNLKHRRVATAGKLDDDAAIHLFAPGGRMAGLAAHGAPRRMQPFAVGTIPIVPPV